MSGRWRESCLDNVVYEFRVGVASAFAVRTHMPTARRGAALLSVVHHVAEHLHSDHRTTYTTEELVCLLLKDGTEVQNALVRLLHGPNFQCSASFQTQCQTPLIPKTTRSQRTLEELSSERQENFITG